MRYFIYVALSVLFVVLTTTIPVANDDNGSTTTKVLTLKHNLSFPFEFYSNVSINSDHKLAVLRAYTNTPRRDYLIVLDIDTGKVKCKLPGQFHGQHGAVIWSSEVSRVKLLSSQHAYDLSISDCRVMQTIKFSDDNFYNLAATIAGDKFITTTVRKRGANLKDSLPEDSIVKIWSSTTLKPLVTLKGHNSGIGKAEFSPDGTKIVTLSTDNTARIWDVMSGAALRKIKFPYGIHNNITFSPQGHQFALFSNKIISNDRQTYVIDIESGKVKRKFDKKDKVDRKTRKYFNLTGPKAGSGYRQVWFSSDGKRLFTQEGLKHILVWDVKTGRKLGTLDSVSIDFNHPVTSDVFLSQAWGALYVNDVQSGDFLGKSKRDSLPYGEANGHLSNDGRTAIIHYENKLQIWKIADKNCMQDCTITPYTGRISESEIFEKLKDAIARKDIETADEYRYRVKKEEIPDAILLDYIELQLLYDYHFHAWDDLKAYKKIYGAQSPLWPRALKLQANVSAMVDRKIRDFQNQKNYKEVNDRLDGRRYWDSLANSDFSIIFYEVIQSAIQNDRLDIARIYLDSYIKIGEYDNDGVALTRHDDLIKLDKTIARAVSN